MPTSSHPIVSGTKIRLALVSTVLHGSHHSEFGDAEDREFQELEYPPGELRGAPAPITFKGQLCPPAPRINRRDFRFLFINFLPPTHTKSADKKCLHFYLGTVKRLEVPLRPIQTTQAVLSLIPSLIQICRYKNLRNVQFASWK